MIDPCDKDVWRSSVRSTMLMHLHFNLNAAATDDDDSLGVLKYRIDLVPVTLILSSSVKKTVR